MLDSGFVPGGIAAPVEFDGRDDPWFARRCGVPDLPYVGTFTTMRARRVALASAWLMACCERALAM